MGARMHNRLRLLRFGAALLYFGPLLAGLMGQGWAMVLAFACVFVLWSVVVRPQLWPRTQSDLSRADLGRSEAAVALASLVASQLLLVIICFAVGRGIGGGLALRPALPAFLPLALSIVAVPISRMISPPQDMADDVGFDPAQHNPPVGPNPPVPATEMLAPVMALPDDVAEDVVQSHLTAISAHLDPVVIRQTLGDEVAGGAATRAAIKALIVHATDPAISDLVAGTAYPAQAFAAAGRDGDLLGLFARRCILLLGDEPELGADCPSAAVVAQAARDCQDSVTASEMNRLAGLLA